MEKEKVAQLLKWKRFRKLTGPPEHWLTTFNTKFWGLKLERENKWNGLITGDLLVFHSTAVKYLQSKPKLPTGIIGIGIVSSIDRKNSLEWIGEIQNGSNTWPLLIHFSELWWFGNTEGIIDEPIRQKLAKGERSVIEDLEKLTNNCITFSEMRQHGCAIPAQGSIANISSERTGPLANLISGRLKTAMSGTTDLDKENEELLPLNNKEDIVKNLAKRTTELRDLNLEETDEEAAEREKKIIRYEANWRAQDNANNNHRKTLDLIAGRIRERGIQAKQSVIDLYAENDSQIFIFEVKSIHTNNFTHQTRAAIGQLLDYEYFQVKNKPEYKDKPCLKGIVYSEEPPENIIRFLRTYEFNVYWNESDKISGDPNSLKILESFLHS